MCNASRGFYLPVAKAKSTSTLLVKDSSPFVVARWNVHADFGTMPARDVFTEYGSSPFHFTRCHTMQSRNRLGVFAVSAANHKRYRPTAWYMRDLPKT